MEKGPSGYRYNLNESVVAFNRKKKKRHTLRRIIVVLFLLSLVAAAAGGGYYIFVNQSESLLSHLPLPTKLIAFRFQLNGQEVILLPESQVVLNPRDSVQLLEVQTDGWVSWGTNVSSMDLDIAALRKNPLTMKDYFPLESFEKPKNVEIAARLWSKPVGKVSFLIQLDAKDWLQKANSAKDNSKKTLYLEKALTENSSNILAKTQLAGLYFEDKRWEQAAKLYKEIDASGKSSFVSERLLQVYQQMGKIDDALLIYLDLLKLNEDQDTFKEFLQYLQKRKSKEDAVRFLEKHRQEIPKSYHSSLLLVMADLSTQTKNWSKAASSYQEALKSGVKDPDILYNLAVIYQQNDDPEKAISALREYLQKNPGDIKSWMQMAELQEKKGNTADARKSYETILQKSPQNKDAMIRLVALLEKSNDKAALIAAYEKLAHAQPKNKTVQHNLAVLYYQGKNLDKASDAFEAVAAMDPKDLESRKYLLEIYRKQKDEKSEFQMLQELAKLDPKNTAYYDELFRRYDDKKDYKAIASLFRTATEQIPDSVQFHNYLLYASLKLNDNKAALRELEHLIRLQPKEKKHVRQAANLYETTGDYGKVLEKIVQLIKIDPKNEEAKEDYLRIKRLTMNKGKSEQPQ